MILRRLLTITILLTSTIWSQAQQINAVPDYVFRNQMSVGRNAVTDTAAYFSIGPRYGATRGMMPPMVVDTASFSANKRNGLLIFSVQKNKFLYWDSVGVKWAEMAGTGGSAITGSGVAGYMPEFTTTTNLDTTRLYHSAGRFAIGSTTTTNGVFNVYGGQSYFDTSLKIGSQTFLADEGKNEVYVNTTSDNGAYALQVSGSTWTNGALLFSGTYNWELVNFNGNLQVINRSTNLRRLIIDSSANIGMGLITDNVGTNSTLYVNSANKRVGIAKTTPLTPLDVLGKLQVGDGASLPFEGSSVINVFKVTSPRISFYDDVDHIASIGVVTPGGGVYGRLSFNVGAGTPERGSINNAGEFLLNSSGSDAGDYKLQVTGAIYNTTTITTGAPTGGSVTAWRLGEAATVSPTSPNRTLRVEVGGTVYYIAAKTTND